MAEVYLGTHLTLDRPVAVKVLHSHVEENEEMKVRFQREARVVAGLRHPNIVQIFDFDTLDGHPYIVMEYLKGPSLAWYLQTLHERNERMQPKHIERLIGKISSALDYAHGEGVIHGILNPAISCCTPRQADPGRCSPTRSIQSSLILAWSASCMPPPKPPAGWSVARLLIFLPSRRRGLRTDRRTDIYSLGIVLYEILAGRVPLMARPT